LKEIKTMAVPKKRTSKAKSRQRKYVWKEKGINKSRQSMCLANFTQTEKGIKSDKQTGSITWKAFMDQGISEIKLKNKRINKKNK
jgi:hypothetical protein